MLLVAWATLASTGCGNKTDAPVTGDHSATTASPQPVSPGNKANPAQTPVMQTAAPQPCVPCATQEDFDAAGKKGRTCCASHGCGADGDCSGGRVCCKVPLGTLCTDAGRCVGSNRVTAAAPGKLAPGTCKTSADCPNAGSDLCCDNGAGKPGKCFGAGSGVKGCNPPK
jgi:hypothetical protein